MVEEISFCYNITSALLLLLLPFQFTFLHFINLAVHERSIELERPQRISASTEQLSN